MLVDADVVSIHGVHQPHARFICDSRNRSYGLFHPAKKIARVRAFFLLFFTPDRYRTAFRAEEKIFPSPLPCSCMQATFTRYIASAFEESRKPDMQGRRASPSCMPHPFLSTTNICAVCFFKISTRALPFSHLARYARLYD